MGEMESFDARLARIEEKLDGLAVRVGERCAGNNARIEAHDKSLIRFGERLGRLEAEREQRKGGKAAITLLVVVGAALGGLGAKLVEWLGRQ